MKSKQFLNLHMDSPHICTRAISKFHPIFKSSWIRMPTSP